MDFTVYPVELLAWLFAVNLLACAMEGGFGFLGALTFQALTVPILGWQAAVLADCILGSVNLVFTAWLHRDTTSVETQSGLTG